MSTKKAFGVLLTEEGWKDLDAALTGYSSEGRIEKYIYCKKVHPDGQYFGIEASCANPDGSTFEADISIPHRYIKCFVSSSEKEGIGFMGDPVKVVVKR